MCLTAVRSGDSCCTTRSQAFCAIRVESADLTSAGAGLHVELWDAAGSKVLDATGVRSHRATLAPTLAPHMLDGGEIRAIGSIRWRSLAVALDRL